MSDRAPHVMSASEIVRLTNAGALTAETVVRDCLDRIALREDAVRAWTFLDPDHAIAQAKEIARRPAGGALRGVPVGIKDIIATADMPTGYGTPIYAGHRPAWDAACVASIRHAGGIIMGKTVTTEFASSHPGKTVHPDDPSRTPGGSSSGSAAAVADHMVPLAVGTQTGGSVIRPASFCGIIGYKPTFAFINRHGVKPLSESFDTVGVMARGVDDAALLGAALMGRNTLMNETTIERPRIAVWKNKALTHAEPATLACLESVVDHLSKRGAVIKDVEEPEEFSEMDAVHHQVEYFEMGQALLFEYQTFPDRLSPALRKRVEQGRAISSEVYDARRRIARKCRQDIGAFFSDFDAILYPSTLGEAPKGHHGTGNALFNRSWTALYGPIITLPVAKGPNRMPLGVQLIGNHGDDMRLVSVAKWVESTYGLARAL